MNNYKLPGSFRDPCGFLFFYSGVLYRQVNNNYKDSYDHLISSGLYKKLVDMELLIPHEEAVIESPEPQNCYKIIRPEYLQFISYPYEWCFSQLKDAALTTLRIQKEAMNYGMSLKDSSSYNIQFRNGKPVFIDTLSFEKYNEGKPWIAYRQFCQHFFSPLALMSFIDVRLSQLLRVYIDGIPLDLTCTLLPFRTCLKIFTLIHLYLHARSQKHFSGKSPDITRRKMSRISFLGLIDSLESAVKKLKWFPGNSPWADYYLETNYSNDAFLDKQRIVDTFIEEIKPELVWDIGANTGLFSRIASDKGIPTISFDNDPSVVELNYLKCINNNETHFLPLLLDITNPGPGIGWENRERMSILERGPADTVFALALIHHLAISNNLPLVMIAGFFNIICSRYLIIEFVPKDDSQVQKLLIAREDIFPEYTKQTFETEFKKFFKIIHSTNIRDSERTIYLMLKT